MPANTSMRCPCRKKSDPTTYGACCEPFHSGQQTAPTAEALMRSRYSAFALRDGEYLARTWHPSTRPSVIDFEAGQEWLLLRIKRTGGNAQEAFVEFEARSRIGGQSAVLRETSRFVFEDGHWLYVDGNFED